MISDRDYTRRMLQTVAAVAGAVVLLAALWAAREALLLIYISALTAMGFSPLVRLIERPRPDDGRRRVPRWLAILVVYVTIVSVLVLVALTVVPPLVAQAEPLWEKTPTEFS